MFVFHKHKKIIKLLKQLLMGQQKLAEDINGLTQQVTKVFDEVKGVKDKLDAVEQNLPDNVSPELQTAFDALKAQVQKVDELIPDAPAADQPPV